jgi:hypothetical protein
MHLVRCGSLLKVYYRRDEVNGVLVGEESARCSDVVYMHLYSHRGKCKSISKILFFTLLTSQQ